MQAIAQFLERFQIGLYFLAIVSGLGVVPLVVAQDHLQLLINPALALMLFVTFLQVPVAQLGKVFGQLRFLLTLAVVNFLLIPLVVWGLQPMVPGDPIIRLAVLFVLLTPCIDYVITFAHVGRADARLLLAATPFLLLLQMLLLPIYLGAFLGVELIDELPMRPFIEAFVGLIIIPLVLAAIVQHAASRNELVLSLKGFLDTLPVPATALVLCVVAGAVVSQLEQAAAQAIRVIPIYLLFSLLAPMVGWWAARWAQLSSAAARAVAFSAGTRNSLVILPLALAIPSAQPLLPVLVVTQTLVELVASLFYMQIMPRLRTPQKQAV